MRAWMPSRAPGASVTLTDETEAAMDPLSFQRRIDRYAKMLPEMGERTPAVFLGPHLEPDAETPPPGMDQPVHHDGIGWVEAEAVHADDIVIVLHPEADAGSDMLDIAPPPA